MEGESPKPGSASTGAVFLSYASQDAEAAQQLCAALRAAGIEVWLDQSELRGGDAWDRQIRRQIHDCALFIPLISQHSQERLEGYFRLEWKLAVDRSHRMAAERSFIVPVVVDSTRERDALVPDSFRDVQWTHLPGGEPVPAFVTRVAALLSAPVPVPTSTGMGPALHGAAAPTVTWHRRKLWSIFGLAALAVIGAGGWFALQRSALHRHAQADAAGAPQPVITGKSIAVLPFVDMSEKHDQEYFADGMAEEILNLLAKVPDLKVIGRTSSFQFKGKTDDLRKIGTTLGSAHIVEGSVRRSGDHIRVTAQLIDTRDGAHRWSDTFDADASDVLKVQEAIGAGIARALQVNVVGGATDDHSIATPDAYDSYLRGLQALSSGSRAGCEDAIQVFSQLLRDRPNSKRLLISLASAHACLGYQDWIVPGAGYPQAREYAAQAVHIDPHSAEAHLILAEVAMGYDYDWITAQREIDIAFQSAAPSALALGTAGRLAGAMGQFDRAIDYLTQALIRDPLDPYIYDQLGDFHARAGHYRQAEEMYRRCLQIAPHFDLEHFWIAYALLLEGQFDAALTEAELEPDDGARAAGRALALHALGRKAESDAALKEFIAAAGREWPSEVARVYAFRGELDRALEWLEQAYRRKDVDLFFLKGDPLLKNLDGDPRYKAFLRKMNLPE
jgi:TolB-like protein/Tfp pilus assembly protein PilF